LQKFQVGSKPVKKKKRATPPDGDDESDNDDIEVTMTDSYSDDEDAADLMKRRQTSTPHPLEKHVLRHARALIELCKVTFLSSLK
jgi:hypothetical protein